MRSYLSPESARIVKMTARAFKAFGKEMAEATRTRLFAVQPNRFLFAGTRLDQPEWATTFGEIMLVVAENIDRLTLVSGLLDELAVQHGAEKWQPEHYDAFLHALLPAIRDVLGEGASDRVLDAWQEDFQHLVSLIDAARNRNISRAA